MCALGLVDCRGVHVQNHGLIQLRRFISRQGAITLGLIISFTHFLRTFFRVALRSLKEVINLATLHLNDFAILIEAIDGDVLMVDDNHWLVEGRVVLLPAFDVQDQALTGRSYCTADFTGGLTIIFARRDSR